MSQPLALIFNALFVIAGLATSVGQTHSSEPRPEFSVASIKPNNGSCCTTYGVGNAGGGGKLVTLKTLIGLAYRLQQFQIIGGPSWVGSDRFDVEGKTEDQKASPAQLRLMLQSLLEDRFRLKVHRATREAPVYALVVAKGGPKIRLSEDQVSPDVSGRAPQGAGPNHGAIRVGVGNLVGNAVPLSLFVTFLSQRLDRLAIDDTHLTGRFNIRLQWAPDAGETLFDQSGNPLPSTIIDMKGMTVATDPSGPSIFSAIQEQLGMKLESRRSPIEVLVIDRVERPSTN
jgi:uncharacterized protein (TIGR03435 family)